MLVVCKGHKTCDDRNFCFHASEHEEENTCYLDKDELIDMPNCECSHRFLRNEKLKNLKLKNASSL